jgi:hypothetical protein
VHERRVLVRARLITRRRNVALVDTDDAATATAATATTIAAAATAAAAACRINGDVAVIERKRKHWNRRKRVNWQG